MIKIANASGFWGDSSDAAARLVAQQPDLDFLTLDYLAEVSLSIMAIMRAKDPAAGYARDFIDVIRSLVPFYRGGGRTKIVTNAGGLDPAACAAAVRAELTAAGLTHLRIATVTGDDVLPLLRRAASAPPSPAISPSPPLAPSSTPPPSLASAPSPAPSNPNCNLLGYTANSAADTVSPLSEADIPQPTQSECNPLGYNFTNLETGEPLSSIASRVVTANAYLGARAIADALHAGADIVITGRVADPSLTVGPCLAHFGWSDTDYHALAGATVAGHLIECGTQACGGFSTDWLALPGHGDIGFPVVEVSADGSCVITKPAGTGGAVTLNNVKEQLLYEIGDPGNYLSPDVTVSFLTLRLDPLAENRVRVSGATGRPPPPTYKVSATYRDGYKAHGLLTIFGHDAVKKARHAGDAVLHKLAARGCVFRATLVECLGTGAAVRGLASRVSDTHLVETVLRVSVAADRKEPVERFTREIAPLVTCGPQGVTGYATGRPKVLPIFGYWPCLVARALVKPTFQLL